MNLDVTRSTANSLRRLLGGVLHCACWCVVTCGIALGQDELELLPPVSSTEAETTPDDILAGPPVLDPTGPMWIAPVGWLWSPIWDVGMELGINGSEGNADALSVLVSTNLKRKSDSNTLDLGLTYGRTKTSGIETQHYAIGNSRWDWNIGPQWFAYNKNILEYDEFKAFDLRVSLTGGLGYHFIENDATTLTGRLGAGASSELGGVDESWVPEANLGLDFERELSARQKVKLTTDYFPAWEDMNDYRLVTNANWEILLDEEMNLSLKIGAIDRYDSTPNGAKPNDISYFVTLLWKL